MKNKKNGMNRNELKVMVEKISGRKLSNIILLENFSSNKIKFLYGDLFGMSKSNEVTLSPSAVRRVLKALKSSRVFYNNDIAVIALEGTSFKWLYDEWVVEIGRVHFKCETLQWCKN